MHDGPASNWVKSTTRMPSRQSSSTPTPIACPSRCEELPISIPSILEGLHPPGPRCVATWCAAASTCFVARTTPLVRWRLSSCCIACGPGLDTGARALTMAVVSSSYRRKGGGPLAWNAADRNDRDRDGSDGTWRNATDERADRLGRCGADRHADARPRAGERLQRRHVQGVPRHPGRAGRPQRLERAAHPLEPQGVFRRRRPGRDQHPLLRARQDGGRGQGHPTFPGAVPAHLRFAAGEPRRDRRRGHGRRLRAGARLRSEDRRQRGQARPARGGAGPAAGRRRHATSHLDRGPCRRRAHHPRRRHGRWQDGARARHGAVGGAARRTRGGGQEARAEGGGPASAVARGLQGVPARRSDPERNGFAAETEWTGRLLATEETQRRVADFLAGARR